MVAATVANGGVRMQPYLVDKLQSADLRTLHTTQPSTINSPIDADQAETLTQLMIASERNTAGAGGAVSIASKTEPPNTPTSRAPQKRRTAGTSRSGRRRTAKGGRRGDRGKMATWGRRRPVAPSRADRARRDQRTAGMRADDPIEWNHHRRPLSADAADRHGRYGTGLGARHPAQSSGRRQGAQGRGHQ